MYSLNGEKFYYDEADGIGVLIDFTTGVYFSLNPIGTAIYNRLCAGADAGLIEETLKALPGCPDNMGQLLNDFIDSLLKNGILVNDDVPSGACDPFTDTDTAEGFEPVADEFTEVQDIIMADPVHDVNEEKGWPNIN